MRPVVLLPLAVLGLLASLPGNASACPVPEACVGEVVVCPSLAPWACLRVDPDELVAPIDLDDLIGPCTCDPIE